jgi:hypothetical protein
MSSEFHGFKFSFSSSKSQHLCIPKAYYGKSLKLQVNQLIADEIIPAMEDKSWKSITDETQQLKACLQAVEVPAKYLVLLVNVCPRKDWDWLREHFPDLAGKKQRDFDNELHAFSLLWYYGFLPNLMMHIKFKPNAMKVFSLVPKNKLNKQSFSTLREFVDDGLAEKEEGWKLSNLTNWFNSQPEGKIVNIASLVPANVVEEKLVYSVAAITANPERYIFKISSGDEKMEELDISTEKLQPLLDEQLTVLDETVYAISRLQQLALQQKFSLAIPEYTDERKHLCQSLFPHRFQRAALLFSKPKKRKGKQPKMLRAGPWYAWDMVWLYILQKHGALWRDSDCVAKSKLFSLYQECIDNFDTHPDFVMAKPPPKPSPFEGDEERDQFCSFLCERSYMKVAADDSKLKLFARKESVDHWNKQFNKSGWGFSFDHPYRLKRKRAI